MQLIYKKNPESQTEKKKKHKYSLNTNVNSKSISICNYKYNNKVDSSLTDNEILFGDKCFDLSLNKENFRRPKGPDYAKIRDKIYYNPLDKLYIFTFLLKDNRYKKLGLKYLQLISKHLRADGTAKLSRAFIAAELGCHIRTVSALSTFFVSKGIINKRRIDYIGKHGKLISDYLIIDFQRFKDLIRYARKEIKGSIRIFRKILLGYGLNFLAKFVKSIKILRVFSDTEFPNPRERKEKDIFDRIVFEKKKTKPYIPI